MRVGGRPCRAVAWNGAEGVVTWVEQRLLPYRFSQEASADPEDLALAIETMQIRGAPSIGAAAAYGLALAWRRDAAHFHSHWLPRMRATRPTAVNLFHACETMAACAADSPSFAIMLDCAEAYADAEVANNRAMGEHLAPLLARGRRRILTHCNAGWLAAVDWGTATAGIYQLARAGEAPSVWVDETRPRLQGARLTAWELAQEGIACRIQADSAAAWMMANGEVDAIVVGADRIAANGDIANKIGTYALSLAARAHGVPMLVAAPSSTFDADCPDGAAIPIEHRPEAEVLDMDGIDGEGQIHHLRVAAAGVPANNPAFDVTPFAHVTAIVSERGVWQPA